MQCTSFSSSRGNLGFITLLQECCEVKQRYLEKQLNQHQSNLYKLEFTWKDK